LIMKNILVLVHDDVGQEARLRAALDVTRALDGHLLCVDVSQVPALLQDVQCGDAAAELLHDELEREQRNREALTSRLMTEGVAWDWIDVLGNLAEVVIDQAKLIDLIVLNRTLDSFPTPDMRGIAGAVLTHAHKPVLAVPDNLRQLRLGGRALIAWDGSAAAAATLAAAVPLLQLASAVRVIRVARSAEDGDLDEPGRYLAHNDIAAELRLVEGAGRSIADAIRNEAARWGADWCAMGAYGHSRLREALFGGVTRRMLTDSEIPLLLGH
jgi:nucleotide-binding universal stress UspA family protein